MNESQREALKEALKNRNADAPAAVQGVLTFKIEKKALFPPGTLRDNSTDLSVDLHKTLQALDTYKDEYFRVEPETETASTLKRPLPDYWAV